MARDDGATPQTSSSEVPYQPIASDERIQQYGDEIENTVEELHIDSEVEGPSPLRAYFIRALALLCACSLSVGSH